MKYSSVFYCQAPVPLELLGIMKKMALSLYPQTERLQKVLDYVNEVHTLTSVLSLDFGKTVSDVHPSLHGSSMELATNISSSTLEGLDQAILGLKTERRFHLQKARLISILEDYKHARNHKEEEKKRARADTRSKGCDWKSTYLREMACRITPNAIEDDLKF
ncbi:UNVERIFIED_CONTAM: microtubule-associated protein 7 [Sesamum indicum]